MSSNQTALITGATSGIGQALVERYLSAGTNVVACGRNKEKLSHLTSAQCQTLVFDITNKQQVIDSAKHVNELDTLILNAGDCRYIDDVLDFDDEVFESVIETNLLSMGRMLKSYLPKIKTGGTVVFVSSIATVLPFSRTQAYGASKAGVDYLANSLRVDLRDKGINVTLVHPGFIKTPLTDKNNFSMPFLMSSQQAAERIYRGVSAGKNYLQFPKRFTFLLKFIALMPDFVWQFLSQKKAEESRVKESGVKGNRVNEEGQS